MSGTSSALREIFAAGRPLVEQWLDVAEQIAALRDTATAKGLDWSQVKALLKATIQDERDESGEGKRVARIVEKAEFASAYADMLGLANMNENNFSARIPSQGAGLVNLAPAPTRSTENRGDEISAPIHPDPHSLEVDGGRPNQSSDAGGAKIDGPYPVDGRVAAEADIGNTKSEQQPEDQSQDRNEPVSEAASSATPFEPPTFLIKASGTMQDTRPHCLNPDACGAWRPGHCYTCSKAAGLNEAAA